MNRAKMTGTIRWALKRNEGLAPDAMASAICDAIEVAIEQEQAMMDNVVVDFPARLEDPPVSAAAPPPSPSVITPQPESIILATVPSSVTQPIDPGPRMDVISWSQYLHAHAPEHITIEIELPDRNVQLVLDRNVVMDHVLKAVKLSYKPRVLDEDMAASHLFFSEGPNPTLQEVIEKIKATAKNLYRPRPRTLTSSTPVRTGGGLTLDMAAGHENV